MHQLHLSTKQHAILSVSSALPSHSSHSSFSSGSRGRSGKLEGASCRKLLQTLVPHGTVARCGKILTLSSFHKVQQQVPHLSSIELCPVAFYTYGFHSWFLILYSGKNVVGAGLCLCIKLSCKHITFSKASNIYHLDAFMITVAQLKKILPRMGDAGICMFPATIYTKALDTDLILPSVWIMALKGYAKDVLVRSENAASWST